MRPRIGLLALGLAVAGALTVRAAGPRTFDIDASRSRALIEVGKRGAFSFFAGHTHEVESHSVSGVAHVDSEDLSRSDIRVEIDAATLRVTGKGEPADDVPKVQQVMLSEQVLDAQRYPKIVFESTSVSRKGGTTTLDLLVAGKLTLRDVTRPLTSPVTVHLDGNTFTATGEFALKQTDYGIKPISVGGVVAVRDALKITFTIVGRERS
jgi:polyisoprenoid-binding protein YceI